MRLLAALLLAAPLLAVQDGVGDERLARFKRYLDRSPYHDQVFQSLLEAARAEGALDGLVEEYRARVTLDGDAAARVVLARLLAEAGAFPAAAEQLLAVSPPTAEARRLTARMQARAGQPAEASRTLAGALELTTDGELLRELHLERADLFLARGLEQDARTAYTTVAELAGQDLVELADLASLMADAGFAGDGVVLLESLRPEVEGDTPRTTQLLAQLGELRERARDGAGALEAYAEALPLLREGHWLRRDLLARSLDLHRRAGSLDRAVTDFRSALVARPGDLETRLSLVAALRLLRRDGEAAEQLRGAVGRHPDDLRLSDQLVAALRELGEDEAVVHELQRALERAPRDARRRFELGCALASAGQVDGADREWTRLIQADPRDTSRADRVAREWARRGEVDRAAGVLRAAIASAPAEVRRYGDLAQLLPPWKGVFEDEQIRSRAIEDQDVGHFQHDLAAIPEGHHIQATCVGTHAQRRPQNDSR